MKSAHCFLGLTTQASSAGLLTRPWRRRRSFFRDPHSALRAVTRPVYYGFSFRGDSASLSKEIHLRSSTERNRLEIVRSSLSSSCHSSKNHISLISFFFLFFFRTSRDSFVDYYLTDIRTRYSVPFPLRSLIATDLCFCFIEVNNNSKHHKRQV